MTDPPAPGLRGDRSPSTTDPTGSDEREEEGAAGPVLPDRPRARRFPGWLLIPLGGAAGWIVSGWGGAAFGCAVGLMIWRSRAA